MKSVMKRVAGGVAVVAVCGWVAAYVPLQAQGQKPSEAQVRTAIEQYIAGETKLKGGFFVRDAKDSRVRDLTLDYVHSGLEARAGGRQVMCADLLDRNKDRLDLDFYVTVKPSGEVQVADIKIHKVNGTERK